MATSRDTSREEEEEEVKEKEEREGGKKRGIPMIDRETVASSELDRARVIVFRTIVGIRFV